MMNNKNKDELQALNNSRSCSKEMSIQVSHMTLIFYRAAPRNDISCS